MLKARRPLAVLFFGVRIGAEFSPVEICMAGQSAGGTLASGVVHVPETGNGGFPYG